jgi:hypothetical protein
VRRFNASKDFGPGIAVTNRRSCVNAVSVVMDKV